MAEKILNALAKVDDLKVAGRTSSFYFKGRNEPLAAIGRLSLLGAPDEALAMIAKQPMNSSAWNLAIWGATGQAARTSPAFPEFARKIGYAALWDQYGPPDLCRKNEKGDYVCE